MSCLIRTFNNCGHSYGSCIKDPTRFNLTAAKTGSVLHFPECPIPAFVVNTVTTSAEIAIQRDGVLGIKSTQFRYLFDDPDKVRQFMQVHWKHRHQLNKVLTNLVNRGLQDISVIPPPGAVYGCHWFDLGAKNRVCFCYNISKLNVRNALEKGIVKMLEITKHVSEFNFECSFRIFHKGRAVNGWVTGDGELLLEII